MKRLLGITLMLVALSWMGFSTEAKASNRSQIDKTTVTANAQWRDRHGRSVYDNRRSRTFTRSRVVRYGRRVYRETYRIRYFANGRTDTRLISRIRIA